MFRFSGLLSFLLNKYRHTVLLFLVLAIYTDVSAQSRKSLLTQISQQQSTIVRNVKYTVPIQEVKSVLKAYFEDGRYGLIEESSTKMKFATKILSQYLVPRKGTEDNSRSKSTRKVVSCGQTVFVEVTFETDTDSIRLTTKTIMGRYTDSRAYQYTRHDGEVPFNEIDLLRSLYAKFFGTTPPINEELAEKINHFNSSKVSATKRILKGRDF